MDEYIDFRISLGATQDNTCPIEVTITPPGDKFFSAFTALSDAELEGFLTDLDILLNGDNTLSIAEQRERLVELGIRLFESIFQDQVRQRYEDALRAGQRLLIQISSQDPSLLTLPWEFAYDPTYRQFLSLYDVTPIVRLIELPSLAVPEPVEQLRLLAPIASPSDLAALNVLQEKKNIRTALGELKEKLQVEFLENAQFESLSAQLAQQTYHVLHFVGHGGLSQEMETGFIYLENEAGQAQLVSGETLGLLLRNSRTVRLVVLNACESARSAWPSPFASVAGALISADVPSVVAMQFPISDRAALAFSKAFYTALTQGYDLIHAVARGRLQIHHATTATSSHLIYEWGTPVLYLGSGVTSPFALVEPALKHVITAWDESSRQEIAYLRALRQLKELQEVRETYVPLQATTWESELEDVSSFMMRGGVDEQEELTRTQQQMGVQLLDEIARHDRVVVLGKPGSGKTTTLRYLAQHYAELALQDNLRAKLPLLASLNEYRPGQEVIDFLREQLTNSIGRPTQATNHLAENLESYLTYGRFVLLFDGLNELQDYRKAIARLIRFMRNYPDNIFVFAGRDADYRGELNIDHQLYIDQLDDRRIVDFVDKRHAEGLKGQEFLRFLKDKGLVELARSPYLLSLMLEKAERGPWADLSRSRTALFDWAVREMWKRERNRPGRDGDWIRRDIENEALMYLAWEMNKIHTTTLERIKAEDIFRSTFAEIDRPDIAFGAALEQAVDAGLLILSSSDQVRFQHQLLQDYLAAHQLQRRFEASESLDAFIADLGWHEAVVLLAGRLGEDARELIKTILAEPDDLFLNNLWLAARCLGEAQSALQGGPRLIRTDLIDRLFEVFMQGEYTVLRRNAEVALVEVGDTRVVSGLKRIMDDMQADKYLRARATRALGRIGTTRVRNLVIEALSNQALPSVVRTRAAEALGRIGGLEAEDALIRMVSDHDQERQVRLRAALALGVLSSDMARAQLIRIARDITEMKLLRELAIVALLSFSDDSEIKEVLPSLVNDQDENRDVRGRAGDVLARFGGKEAREAFTRILYDTNESVQVRARVALNLGALGDSKDIPVLTTIAQDRALTRRLRWNATYALGYILRRVRDEPTVALLGEMLKDEDEDNYVRWTAAYALGFSGSERGLRELVNVISRQYLEYDVKRRTVEALSRYKDDEAVEALIKVVQNPEENLLIRDSARQASIPATDVVEKLRKRILRIKDGALHGLTRIGGERALSVFISVAQDKDSPPGMRRRALLALGTWGDVDEVDLLQGIVNDAQEPLEVRAQAFTALEWISRSHRLRLYPKIQEESTQEEVMFVETFAIPVLVKAVDFLFDQAKKILEERRAARQSGKTDVDPPNIPLLEQDKDVVLKRKVSEEAIKRKERAIQGILKELEILEQNYQDQRIVIARYGSWYDAEPIDRRRFQEAEDAVLEASQRLAALMESLTESTEP